MAISKTNTGYRAELYINHKRIGTKRGFQTKKEAKRWIEDARREYEADPLANKEASKTDPTFEQLVETYRKLHLPKVRVQTQERYETDLNLRIIPKFKFYKLKNITPAMVLEFQAELLKSLSPKSVNNCLAVLKGMFNFGETIGMIDTNPTRRAKLLKIAKKKYLWWERPEDIQKFLTAIATQPLGIEFFEGKLDPCRAAYRLALECGMRLGEVIGLSKQDVDFERGQIHVHRQWLVKKDCYGPTKQNQVRYIGFDPSGDLAKLLKETIAASPDPEIIFVALSGERMRADKLSSIYFMEWIEKLGLPTLTFHGLRHTFASWFMKRGGDIWKLMKVLGHSDISTTMRYAHLSSEIDRVPSFDMLTRDHSNNHI